MNPTEMIKDVKSIGFKEVTTIAVGVVAGMLIYWAVDKFLMPKVFPSLYGMAVPDVGVEVDE